MNINLICPQRFSSSVGLGVFFECNTVTLDPEVEVTKCKDEEEPSVKQLLLIRQQETSINFELNFSLGLCETPPVSMRDRYN